MDEILEIAKLEPSILYSLSLAVISLSFKNHWILGFGNPSIVDSNFTGWSLMAIVSDGLVRNLGAPKENKERLGWMRLKRVKKGKVLTVDCQSSLV